MDRQEARLHRESGRQLANVVTLRANPVAPPQANAPVEVLAPETSAAATPKRGDVAALEAEASAFRRGNSALKSTVRVLLEA